MTQKHTKYSPEWEQKNKFIIGKQIEKEFKKGEKKPDDTEVTADTEKVKVNDYEDLIREREALKVDYEAKKEVVKTKSGYAGKIANAETGRTNDGNYNNQSNSFLTSGSGAANPYRTKGWFKLIADWNNKPFTPTTAGATAKDYTNLYEVCFNSGYNQMSIKMTENELIKFITRTLKEYEKIDTTTTGETFQDYLTTKKPATVSIVYTDYGTTTTPDVETDTIVNGYLTTLKAHAKNLVETTDEKTGRKEYAFGHNFVNDNGTGMKDTPFDVKKSVLKDIPHKTELTFIPAQDKPYTEGKLHELGQENYTDSSFANSRLVSSSLQIHYNENAETTDEFGSFNDRAATPHYYTLLDFPKHAYEQEIRAKELEGLMKAELERLGKGGEELRTAQEEADQAHKKVKEKEQEINDLITARLKEKREVLKTKYKFDATTAPNFGSIRHAETGDEEKESSVPNENTALERIKELISESDIHTIRSLWDNNVVKKYEAGLETVFDQAKIDKWKEKKDGQDAFTNTTGIEKLIKKISIFKKGADDKDEFEKINDEFLTFAKGQDAKYKTLADIFKEEPKKVITLIYHEKGGKKIVDSYDLPDSEKAKFDEYLYECAIGKINESTLTKPTEKKKDDDENKNKEMSAWKE
ncbi:10326_t:CDS:2 [Funneliformis geosporum]|nr:10326_t:CDS:2 [Funneliformis geosporum]